MVVLLNRDEQVENVSLKRHSCSPRHSPCISIKLGYETSPGNFTKSTWYTVPTNGVTDQVKHLKYDSHTFTRTVYEDRALIPNFEDRELSVRVMNSENSTYLAVIFE